LSVGVLDFEIEESKALEHDPSEASKVLFD
jgi:hypothetical protein